MTTFEFDTHIAMIPVTVRVCYDRYDYYGFDVVKIGSCPVPTTPPWLQACIDKRIEHRIEVEFEDYIHG